MELTNLRRINNTKKLPGYAYGSLPNGVIVNTPGNFAYNRYELLNTANANIPKQPTSAQTTGPKSANTIDYSSLISSVPGAVGTIYDSFTNYKSSDELLNEANVFNSNVGGIGYQRSQINNSAINSERKSREVNNVLGGAAAGASVGSVAGPWGAAIGGVVGGIAGGIGSIFSHKKEKAAQERANRLAAAQNGLARNEALTKSIRMQNAKQYGDPSAQYLYGAKDGKEPVITPYGMSYEAPNAKVSNGEIVGTLDEFGNVESAVRVPGKKNNKDTKLARLSDGTGSTDKTFVISNKNGLSDWAAITGDYKGALSMQQQMKNNNKFNGMYKAKCGKLPKMKEGALPNAITAGLGSIAGLALYLQARNNAPYKPNTYVRNPYETEALSTLAGLRVNPYPITQQLRSAESRANRAIAMSGGLSGAQRNLSRLSALSNTQRNIADALASIQMTNNSYLTDYSKALLSTGAANAQRAMQANQYDLDYYSKAHAARQKGMQTGINNMLSQLQSYQANEFKRNQFNDMMAQYRADQEQARAAQLMQNEYNQKLLDAMNRNNIWPKLNI